MTLKVTASKPEGKTQIDTFASKECLFVDILKKTSG